MEVKELADLLQTAVAEMHKTVERQDEEIKKFGEASAESQKAYEDANKRIDAIKESIDNLDVKLQRRDLPGGEGNDADPSEAAKARKAAFYKYIREGAQALDPTEKKALVEDATGLYLVEPELDQEIVRSLPTLTIMRSLCTVRTIGSESIKMRSMGEASVGWGKLETGTDPDESTLTPGAPTYQYVEDLYGLSKIGEDELADSSINLEAILADSFSRALGEAEETAFVVGLGHDSNQPEGFTTNATLIAATQTTTAAGAVTVEKFMDMLYAVPTQYRRNGVYLMNSTLELAIRKLRAGGFAAGDGPFLWQPSVAAGNPNTFIGKPIYTQDDMLDLSGTAAVIAAFGDFKVGYRILDRSGMSIQRLTELYSEAGLVGFKIHKRVGGGVMRASQAPISLLTEHA